MYTFWFSILICLLSLVACLPEQPSPVLKIGLLAPFEGEQRQLGDPHLLATIRAATPERVQGRRVEWVILDTHGVPEMARQRARELLVDPAVLAIIGPLLPEEVEAVASLMENEKIAWWPLAPQGESGLQEWVKTISTIDVQKELTTNQLWGARAFAAVRRGEITEYLDPQLPPDLGDFAAIGGEYPWPQNWLAWQATNNAFDALAQANPLTRSAVLAVAEPLEFPSPVLYESQGGNFPGIAR